MIYCKKCLTGRTGDVAGQPCSTKDCDGILEEAPEFKDLVDHAGEQRCPRRDENSMADTQFPGPDAWEKFKHIDNRVCSYCGSLHPDDFLRLVREAATAPEEASYLSTIRIEPSDKGYKIYVHQPGVRNAHEGGIKFYTPHLPTLTTEQDIMFQEAVRKTRVRFERYMEETRRRRGLGEMA